MMIHAESAYAVATRNTLRRLSSDTKLRMVRSISEAPWGRSAANAGDGVLPAGVQRIATPGVHAGFEERVALPQLGDIPGGGENALVQPGEDGGAQDGRFRVSRTFDPQVQDVGQACMVTLPTLPPA